MVEYGNGVGEVAGRAGGGHAQGQTADVGASLARFVNDSVHTIATAPPGMLFVGVVVILLGLFVLRRAF
jgi:hypothetical protein